MDKCFPSKTVRMSSTDPVWITSLVKVFMKKRNKLQIKNLDSAKEISNISKRIAQLIQKNQKALKAHRIGSHAWWKNVDKLLNRKGRNNNILSTTNLLFTIWIIMSGNYVTTRNTLLQHLLVLLMTWRIIIIILSHLTISHVMHALSNIKHTAQGRKFSAGSEEIMLQ